MGRSYTVLTVIKWPAVKCLLKQKGGERWETIYRINRNQVPSGKMSLKQKGGERWGKRIPY